MQVDSFSVMGSQHVMCEDYTATQEGAIVVSDGCSNGGGPRIFTDWGSRILAQSALKNLESWECGVSTYLRKILDHSEEVVNTIGNMQQTCLTATLLVMNKKDNLVRYAVVGDGVFGGLKKDGTWTVNHVSFIPGGCRNEAAPFYLRYLKNGLDNYLWLFGGQYLLETFVGKIDELGTPVLSIQEKCSHLHYAIEGYMDVNDYDFVFVATDGFDSFHKPTEQIGVFETVKFIDVFKVVFDGISRRQGFLSGLQKWLYRMNKPNTFKKLGWTNYDDFTIAGMWL